MKKSLLKFLILKFARMQYLNRWLMLAVDIFIAVTASILSFFIICLFINEPIGRLNTWIIFLYSFFAGLISLFLLKTYKDIIRHFSFVGIWKLFGAVFFKIMIGGMVLFGFPIFSSSVILPFYLMLDFLITMFFLVFVRIIVVSFYKFTVRTLNCKVKPILIYGVNSASVEFASAMDNFSKFKYSIQGFVTDAENMKYQTIGNKEVYYASTEEEFQNLFEDSNIECLLFVSERAARSVKDTVVSYCLKNNVTVLISSSIGEMKDDNNLSNHIREIQIEDLLNRDEVHINMEKISNSIEGKTILVTGAAGSIGSELCRQLAALPIQKLIFLDCAETPMFQLGLELVEKFKNINYISVIGDVRAKERLNSVFTEYKPQIVFHAAAYKHVPLMEENPCEAFRVNTKGTMNLADASVAFGVERFIMISTDKAVNPTSVMGASKRLAEIYVQSLDAAIKKGEVKGSTSFITTRFGNVLGSNGSVIPFFRDQIKKGGPITVTHPDITRFFMTIPEACRLVLEASVIGNGSEIFAFEMGEAVKIVDLAKKMIKLGGLKEGKDIEIVFTGLRPGEKLYEEVLSDKECTLPTSNPKICIAKVREYDYHTICLQINELSQMAKVVNVEQTIKLMKEIIPEYISQNSSFQKFDKK